MESDQSHPVIIQNGSSNIKVGFASQQKPRHILPSVVGKPKHKSITMIGQNKDYYFTQEAIAKRGVLNLFFPIEKGSVTNFDCLEQLLNHCFYNQLRVPPQEQPLMLAQTLLQKKQDQQNKIVMAFEKFNVPAFYLVNRSKLSMYASGRTTGFAIHSGDQVTQYLGLNDGNIIKNGYLDTFLGGSDVTQYFRKLLQSQLNLHFTSSAQKQIVKQIKQKECYVSPFDYQQEQKRFSVKAAPNDLSPSYIQYRLPDENVIQIKDQIFKAPQIMFQPGMLGQDAYGMHLNTYNSIKKISASHPELQKQMINNIVLSGGNSMLSNLKQRLQKQLNSIYTQNKITLVIALPQRAYSSWVGGSIINELSTFQQKWITKAQYQEYGSGIVHKKCYNQFLKQ